jgi:pimeloyl-ACP methyl ester carboxylesterase
VKHVGLDTGVIILSTATIANITIGYDDLGQGKPIVLIHGHPFNRSMWAGQVSSLHSTHRVIAPDLRGYGATTVTPGKVTLADHARDIVRLLDYLELEHIILGGLSMGGQIVLEFYWQFPQRVQALILAATFAHLDTPAGRQNRLRMADRLAGEGMAPYAREVLPKMIAPATIQEQPSVASHVLHMMETTPPEGAAAALRGRAERRDYTPLLPQISVPVLILVGSDDAFTSVSEAEKMQRAIPDAQLRVIEGAGHMPNLEREAAFNTALHAWLAAIQ